jgi:hypothetical protein
MLNKKKKKIKRKKIFFLKNNFQIKYGIQNFFFYPSTTFIGKAIQKKEKKKKKKRSLDLFFSNASYCCNWGMNRSHILSLKKIMVEEKKNFRKLSQWERRHQKNFQKIISIGSGSHMSNENQIFILRFFQWQLLICNNINNDFSNSRNSNSSKTLSKNAINELFALWYDSQNFDRLSEQTKEKNTNNPFSLPNTIGINYDKKKMQSFFGFFWFKWRQNEELVCLPKKLTNQSCFSLKFLTMLSALFFFLDTKLGVEKIFFLMIPKKKKETGKKYQKIVNSISFFFFSFFFNHQHPLWMLLHERKEKPWVRTRKKIKYKNNFYWQLFQVKLKTLTSSLLFFFSETQKDILENCLQDMLVDHFWRGNEHQKKKKYNYFSFFFSENKNENKNLFTIKRVATQANQQNTFYFFGWEILESLSTLFFLVRKKKWFSQFLKKYYCQEFKKKNFVIHWNKNFFKIGSQMKQKNRFFLEFFQKFIAQQMIRRMIKEFMKILISSPKKKKKKKRRLGNEKKNRRESQDKQWKLYEEEEE